MVIADAVLPVWGAETVYAKIGNLLGWTCFLAAAGLVALSVRSQAWGHGFNVAAINR
jgi:hypothetical protein